MKVGVLHITARSQYLGKDECSNQTSGTREPLSEISVTRYSYSVLFSLILLANVEISKIKRGMRERMRKDPYERGLCL
jgi:hypothetical protein